MSKNKDIEIAVQKLAGTYLKDIVSIVICNVDSVDGDNRKCSCTPIGGDADTSIPDVLLCAENDNGLVVFPKVGSTVIVALSIRNTAFVVMYSTTEKVQFMDGTYGGMAKIIELTKKINDLENNQNAILEALKGITVTIPSGGGAVPFAPFFAAINDLIPTKQSDIENDLITHGK